MGLVHHDEGVFGKGASKQRGHIDLVVIVDYSLIGLFDGLSDKRLAVVMNFLIEVSVKLVGKGLPICVGILDNALILFDSVGD